MRTHFTNLVEVRSFMGSNAASILSAVDTIMPSGVEGETPPGLVSDGS